MDQTNSIDASGRLVRCCKCVCPWTMSTSATGGGGLVRNAEPEVPLQTCRIEYLPLRVLQVIHARVHSVVQTLARQRREGQSVLPRETGPGGGASSQLCDSPRYPPPHLHYFWVHSRGCSFISLSSKGSAAEVGVLRALCCIIRPSQSSVTSPKVS